MEKYKKLLLANRAWVAGRLEVNEHFFEAMSRTQTPEYLWIGCSDSRVPSEEVTGTEPGELFVHRNVANQIIESDPNSHSVVQYAVEVLKVKHIIVCGHYGCGGVLASMTDKSFGFIDHWLKYIKNVRDQNHIELDAIKDQEKKSNRLVELNVLQQVQNLAKSETIQKAWMNMQQPTIHGWIYELRTGFLKDLYMLRPNDSIDQIYKRKP